MYLWKRGCYIRDTGGWEYKCMLPEGVAFEWAKEALTLKEYLKNDWLNKQYIVVAIKMDTWFAVYNHDGQYWLMEIKDEDLYENKR